MCLGLNPWLWSHGGFGKVTQKLFSPLYFHEIENDCGQLHVATQAQRAKPSHLTKTFPSGGLAGKV